MDARRAIFPKGESGRGDEPVLACEIGEYFHLNFSIVLNWLVTGPPRTFQPGPIETN
jgi:hypothetical protein